MKEFLEIMGKDILSENFTKKEYVMYGIIAPLVLVLLCGLVGSLARRTEGRNSIAAYGTKTDNLIIIGHGI